MCIQAILLLRIIGSSKGPELRFFLWSTQEKSEVEVRGPCPSPHALSDGHSMGMVPAKHRDLAGCPILVHFDLWHLQADMGPSGTV